MPLDSLVPTMILSPVASASLPDILDSIPGMMRTPLFERSLAPVEPSASVTVSVVSFPAENAVRTESPSVSRTSSHAGTLLFSTSAITVKYVSEKLVVNNIGAFSPGEPTG